LIRRLPLRSWSGRAYGGDGWHGRGAAAGILFRNAESLQMLGKVKCLVVDKTGTLTVGRPEIISVIAMPPYSEADALACAAASNSQANIL